MMRTTPSLCLAMTVLVFQPFPAATGWADETVRVAVVHKAPPQELAPEIRAALQPKAVRLTEAGQPFFEIWLRHEIPLAETPAPDSFALEALAEGTVVGALQVYSERYDFKDDEIPPGVYVLRFCLQPEDGDHLGTSPTRTFVVLIPAKNDTHLEAFTRHKDLEKGSSVVNASEHPSNLNLQPVSDPPGRFPSLASHYDDEHQVVNLQVPARIPGKKGPQTIPFALVYEGMGDI